MVSSQLSLIMVTFVVGVVGAQIISESDTIPFSKNYQVTWGGDHATIKSEMEVDLLLDQYSGAGFKSKQEYRSGYFRMKIKLPANKSPGVVTAFYLTSKKESDTNQGKFTNHDELDFEFLSTNNMPILQTNIFASDGGNREQRLRLWFDPTADFHYYGIMWNPDLIVFFVDKIPIRMFKNNKKYGVNYPTGPMHIEASIWHGDWAGKINWAKAPFIDQFKHFQINGCTSQFSTEECASEKYDWNQVKDISTLERQLYAKIRKTYMFYDYCTDRPQKECKLASY